jgi:hypothetical protein
MPGATTALTTRQAERVAGSANGYQRPDRHRGQQADRPDQLTLGLAGRRDHHQAGDVEREGQYAERERPPRPAVTCGPLHSRHLNG